MKLTLRGTTVLNPIRTTAMVIGLLCAPTILLAEGGANDPDDLGPVRTTMLVDFLKARSNYPPVIECRDQDYPVFGVDIKVFNLGPNINSGYSDYNPVLDKKETFMLFTSRRNTENGEERDIDGQYFEKMMVSHRKDGVFQPAQPITEEDSLFGRLPSSERHESLIFLSYSEDLLITYTDEKLYYSNRIGDFYTEPVEFPRVINKGKWKRHASITEDGRTLYFTTESTSKVSQNLNLDIWEIERNDDGSWKRPKKLPEIINSPYNEDSPEISPDGRFLFFSSNRVGGLGGFDIYMAEKVDGVWQEPKNLCQPINTAADDIYFKLSRNGNYAYYSSNILGGQGNMDIYKVVLDVPSIATCGSYAYGRRNINFNSPFSLEFYGEGKEFFWSFGDGQTGVGSNVNHEYTEDGDYQVVLYVRDKSSQRVVNTVFSKKVRVDTENSNVDIIGPDTAELGHEFHFDGTDSYVEGQPATAFYWKVDGQLVSREPEINYEFTRVGRHKIELEVGVLDERVMELSSACIAREVEVITPFEYQRTVGARKGSEGFSYSSIVPDQVLYDMGVSEVDDPLELENDYIKTWQEEAKSFSAFENDRSPGISLDKVIDVSKANHGTVKVKNANYGLLVYQPEKGFFGYDEFTYTVRSKSGEIASATVVVSVMQRVAAMQGQNVTNDEVTIDDAVVGEERSVKIFPLQNDDHELGGPQKIVDLGKPTSGAVQQVGLQGLIEYSPNASFQGSDAFTYTVEDEEGKQSTASVIIKSKDVSKARLYANPDYLEIGQGEIGRLKVFANDVIEGKASIISVSEPKHGSSRVINPMSGDIFYGPDDAFAGSDAFTYTIEDEQGRIATSSVTVVVNPKVKADKPLVIETFQQTPVNAFIFDEFRIPPGYNINRKITAKNGKVEVIDTKKGILKYTPDKDFLGFDMFYVDVASEKDKAQLGLIVKVKGQKNNVSKYGVATNTLFINVNGRTIIDVRKFDYGRLSEDELMIAIREAFDAAEQLDESKVGFTYDQLDKEQYAITYQVQDDDGNLNAASMIIYPVDELGIPIVTRMVLNPDDIKTKNNTPLTVYPLLNDRHLRGQSMRIVQVSSPHNGTMVLDQEKESILYVPNLDFQGTDAFTYTVEDESGTRASTAVNVTVLNEVEYALEEQGFNPRLKAFDYTTLSPDEQALTPQKVVDATNGLFGMVDVTNAYTGEVKYTPNKGFAGQDRFNFTLQYETGESSSHSVVAFVDKRNEFVEGNRKIEARVQVYDDEVLYFYGLINKIHPLAKEMNIISVKSEKGGTTNLIGNAAFAYKPLDFHGLDKLVYTVMDADGELQHNEVVVEVKKQALRPDPEAMRFKTPQNIPLQISLKGTVEQGNYHDHTAATHGTVKLNSAENLLFTYDAPVDTKEDQFSVAIRSAANQLSFVDVHIDILPAVDVVMDAPSMEDFSYDVTERSGEFIQSVSPGKKGEVIVNKEEGTISYVPYAAATGIDQVSYLLELANGAVEQRQVEVFHVPHATLSDGVDKVAQAVLDGTGTVLVYAFSNMPIDQRAGANLDKVKGAKSGSVKILDAERGIIEYVPEPGARFDDFTYVIKNSEGVKQSVDVYFEIEKPLGMEVPTIAMSATPEVKAFNYELLEFMKEEKLKFIDVSDVENGNLEVLDPERGIFSYEALNATGEEYALVEVEDMRGERFQIPVLLKSTSKDAYSARSLNAGSIVSVESNARSFHPVLKGQPEGVKLVSAGNARAGTVKVLDTEAGIIEYTPYTGFVGEDAYVFEYVDEDGNLYQKEMKVVVRDPSVGVISMVEIERQSKEVEAKVTNLSEDLAQAQAESIAAIPEDNNQEVQRALTAQRERRAQEEWARMQKREEAERLAQLEAKNAEEARQAEQRAQEEAQAKALAAKALEQEALVNAEARAEKVAEKEAEVVASNDASATSKTAEEEANVVFRNILFDFDKSDLRPLSIEELNKIHRFMVAHPDYELQLDGHADWIGTVEYNLALSERRAKQAYEFLLQKGISEGRMVYQYYGEAIPIAPNAHPDGSDNPEGRQLNRRCEFEVKERGSADIIMKF